MSNKGYAILLVLAGMVCGILVVSLTSSPATAKLPAEGLIITTPKGAIGSSTPVVARQNIRVYPVGTSQSGRAHAYVVKDGELWHCENTIAYKVKFR